MKFKKIDEEGYFAVKGKNVTADIVGSNTRHKRRSRVILILDRNNRNREIVKDLEQIFSSLKHELANSTHALKITLTVLQDNYDRLDDIKRKHYVKRGLDILARQEDFIAALKSYSAYDVLENLEFNFLQFWESFLNEISGRVKKENIQLSCNNDVEPCRILADSRRSMRH